MTQFTHMSITIFALASAICQLKITVSAESLIKSANSNVVSHTEKKPSSKPAYKYPTVSTVKPVKRTPTSKPVQKFTQTSQYINTHRKNQYKYPSNKPICPTKYPTSVPSLEPTSPTFDPTFMPSAEPTSFCVLPCLRDGTCGCKKWDIVTPGFGPDIAMCYNNSNFNQFISAYNGSQSTYQANLILPNPNFPSTSTFPGDAATCAGKKYTNNFNIVIDPFNFDSGAAYQIGTEYYNFLNSDVNGTILVSCSTGTYIGVDCSGAAGGAVVGTLQLVPGTDLPKHSKLKSQLLLFPQ